MKPAHLPPERPWTVAALAAVRQDGYAAGRARTNPNLCPFFAPEPQAAWLEGWRLGVLSLQPRNEEVPA